MNESLLKLCLYHKGEEECPFAMNTIQNTFWRIEDAWMKDVVGNTDHQDKYALPFVLDFPDGLEEFNDIPEYLKATMHNYYTHFSGGYSSGFPTFLRAYKENAPK